MRIQMWKYCVVMAMLVSLNGFSQQLIQGTLKLGANPNEVEVWIKPNFNNTTNYLFQIGMPIAWPANAIAQPLSIKVDIDPTFKASFGNNYTLNINAIASSTDNQERYFNIIMIRTNGSGTSLPQNWTAGQEYKVVTVTFNNPSCSPSAKVKLADYQDGGSDGLGNFYTQAGLGDYYVTSNSVGNFYSTPGQSIVGGTSLAGFAQTAVNIPTVCPTPAVPVSSNIGTSTADISWPATCGVISYEYAVSTSSAFPSTGTPVAGTGVSLTSLDPGTQYYVFIRSVCSSGNVSSWSFSQFTTQVPACPAPLNVTISPAITDATVSWDPANGVAGYEYDVTTDQLPPASGNPTTSTSVPVSGLLPGISYYAHVRSSCGGVFSSWTSQPFVIPCPLTAIPGVSGISTSQATVSWPAVPGASGYEYVLSTDAPEPVSGTPTNATTHVETNLNPGTQYYIHVRTACAGGSYSGWVSVPFTTVCPMPPTPVVSQITPSGAHIDWDEVNDNKGYQYFISTSNVPNQSPPTTIYNSQVASGLQQGTTYYVYVRTVCNPGIVSQWATASFTTTYPPCNPPTINPVTSIGSNATISWSNVSGAISYEYVISTSSAMPVSGQPINGTSYQAAGLSSNTQYYVFVRSSCGAGRFSQWASQSFKTSCFKPIPFIVENITKGGTAKLGWNRITGAVEYEYAILYYPVSPAGSLNTTKDTSLYATNLTPGGKYYLHVRTHCGPGSVSEWGVLEFHIPGIGINITAANHVATVTLYGSGVQNGEVALFDRIGRLLNKAKMNGNTVSFNMGRYAAGIYFIRYGNDKGSVSKFFFSH